MIEVILSIVLFLVVFAGLAAVVLLLTEPMVRYR
jgi:hypothetical protein